MTFFDYFNVGWPWMGLGIGAVLLILLFGTDLLHLNGGSRWKDVTWLAWLAVPVYQIHQFEEYALHMTDWTYDMVSVFYSDASPMAALGGMEALPLAHFPLVNIALVWLAVPVAALLSRKHPVIGLSPYGFILANGFLHAAGGIVMGMTVSENAGFFTGLLLFLPLAVWVGYAAVKSGSLSKKGVVIAYVSGFLGHVALGSCYLFALLGLSALVLVDDIVVSFLPLIVAWVLCKVCKISPR
ncbi:MAG: HXXEE domain-containing protein [Ruminiclostridium sp.]|nr:HXXEE domain-containing protein [Ruminiclostridium sp.]